MAKKVIFFKPSHVGIVRPFRRSTFLDRGVVTVLRPRASITSGTGSVGVKGSGRGGLAPTGLGSYILVHSLSSPITVTRWIL
jgi:hypothetical protein